jgi:hypothetical protein
MITLTRITHAMPMSVRVIGDAHAPAALSYRTPNVRNPG